MHKNKSGHLPEQCRQPIRCQAKLLNPNTAAGFSVDDLTQQMLALGVFVQSQLRGHYVVPGPIQKGYLPSAVGFGEQRLDGAAQQIYRIGWKSGGGQTAFQALPENVRQAFPLQTIQIVKRKSILAVAVDSQQGGTSPQVDDVEIPAEAAVLFLAVWQGFDTQMPLKGYGQAQFYGFISAHGEWSLSPPEIAHPPWS